TSLQSTRWTRTEPAPVCSTGAPPASVPPAQRPGGRRPRQCPRRGLRSLGFGFTLLLSASRSSPRRGGGAIPPFSCRHRKRRRKQSESRQGSA
uniref:Uncharacterized protein n=1 Tax=Triticum urartu TaxID=4572 RepID=A0A8R7K2K1_TRIUA